MFVVVEGASFERGAWNVAPAEDGGETEVVVNYDEFVEAA